MNNAEEPVRHTRNSSDKNDKPEKKAEKSIADNHEPILGKSNSTWRTYFGLGKVNVEGSLNSQKGI